MASFRVFETRLERDAYEKGLQDAVNQYDALMKCAEALRWFIDDIDGTRTVMIEFDANVERARAALTALESSNG